MSDEDAAFGDIRTTCPVPGPTIPSRCGGRVAWVVGPSPMPPTGTAGVLALRCEKPLDLPGERQERLRVDSPSLNKALKGFSIPLDTVLVERLPV